MRFYYVSIFSWAAYFVVIGVAITVLWLLWTKALKSKTRNPIFWILVVAILVLPWSEELWIAYNFGQLCRKDSGIFVNKTVEVDGFYDDTHGWRANRLRQSGYRFVEGRDGQTYWRHEYVGEEIQSSMINRPTARYHYKRPHTSTPVAYKIRKTERVVIDNQTNETLARETVYARHAYWFFISLSAPVLLCKDVDQRVSPNIGSIYNAALKPVTKR